MKTILEKQESLTTKIDKHLDNLPGDDRLWSAIDICRTAILNVSSSHVEEMGIVELLKDDLKEFFKLMQEEDKKGE